MTRETPFKVSPALALLIAGFHERLGLGVEVFTTTCEPVLAAGGGELQRLLEVSAHARTVIASMLRTGRRDRLDVGDGYFQLQPLRGPRTGHPAIGFLAARPRVGAAGSLVRTDDVVVGLVECLKIAIEADLAMTDSLRDERVQAGRTRAALRFLRHLSVLESEAELAHAVVHAAAVWFDADARIYRRDASGALALHTALPGVTDAAAGLTLDTRALTDLTRGPHGDLEGLHTGMHGAGSDPIVLPITVDDTVEWVLAVTGTLPDEARGVFETVGRTLGAHFQRVAALRHAAVRSRIESILADASGAPEAVLAAALRQLLIDANGAAGAVTLIDQNGPRHLAAVGDVPPAERLPEEASVASDRFAYAMTLGSHRRGLLQIMPARGAALSTDAIAALRAAAPLFQVFLSGAALREADVQASEIANGFLSRITEELERAKRFDLALSMLLIQPEPAGRSGAAIRELVSALRAELRTSDLVGVVADRGVAALLIQTDVTAVSSVVGRVRQRLEGLLPAVGLNACQLGRAVLSSDCRTARELLLRASRDTQAVVAN